MSDIPAAVHINEEGPREGFQIEKGPIATARKIELIDALSQTGIDHMQIVSFVNPKAVPGMADADEVVEGIKINPDVAYTALWLNERGFERALTHDRLALAGSITLVASEKFSKRNQNRTAAEQLAGPACDRREIQSRRRSGRARHDHGGVRLQFRRRRAGVARRVAGAANSRRGERARRHAEIYLARRHHGLGQSARHQARRRHFARALARCRFRAASARHPRHGGGQCVCRSRNGRETLRRRGRRA